MIRASIFLIALSVSACQSPAEEAEVRYETAAKSNASAAKLCQEAAKVADAYLSEGLTAEYVTWDARSANHCYDAKYGK